MNRNIIRSSLLVLLIAAVGPLTQRTGAQSEQLVKSLKTWRRLVWLSASRYAAMSGTHLPAVQVIREAL